MTDIKRGYEFNKLEMGLTQIITDEYIKNSLGGKLNVKIKDCPAMRAIAINVITDFMSKQLKRIEKEYYVFPKLLRIMFAPFRKKLVIEIDAIYPEIPYPELKSNIICFADYIDEEE